jgi:hypothetical protein
MRSFVRPLGLALLISLAGCASVPVTSIVPLMQVDLATTDAEQLRVALQLPEGLQSRPGGVALELVLKREGSPDRNEQFLLVDTVAPADLAGLIDRQKPGQRLAVFRIASADVPRFAAIQAALAEAKRNHVRGSLGFGIATREFCLSGGKAPSRYEASTYLMTAGSNGWITVTDGFDLASDPRIAAGLKTLGPC